MPNTVQVRINTINPVVRGQYNMIEVTGYDETNRKGFKKAFFAEKKDGGITANAANVKPLGQDDWAEFVLDDTSYNNVQTVKAISAPANAQAPAQTGGGSGGGGAPRSGGGAKTGRSVSMLNREKALDSAVHLMMSEKITKKSVDQLEKLAYRMEAFLTLGEFNAEVAPELVDPEVPVAQPGNTTVDSNTDVPVGVDEGGDGGPTDDDIPF
jgi:hypothetical protein